MYKKEYQETLIKQLSITSKNIHHFLNRNPEILKEVESIELLNDYPQIQKVYWYINSIYDFPVCPVCGNQNRRKIGITGYNGSKKYCCSTCSHKSQEYQSRYKNSMIQKYGADNSSKLDYNKEKASKIFKDPRIQQRIKQTMLSKYGSEYPIQSDEIKNRIKNTIQSKYGFDNVLKNEEIKQKVKDTCISKYGCSCCLNNREIKEKVISTNTERYGTDIPSKSNLVKKKISDSLLSKWKNSKNEILEKMNQTKITKYGSSNYQNIEKFKRTCIERYGSNSPLESDIIKEKIKNTIKNQHNCDWYVQSDDFKKKAKDTSIQKYGTTNPAQSEIVKRKILKTRLSQIFESFSKNSFVEPQFDLDYYLIHYQEELLWKCKKCGSIFKARKDTNFNLNDRIVRCWKCYPRVSGTSKEEQEIYEFLCSYIDKDDIIQHDRTVLKDIRKELDFYIPKYNLAIEFDGLYWHSNSILGDKYLHQRKFDLCKKKNIFLMHIFENEWLNKKDVVKSRILHLIGKESSLSSHQYTIKEISVDETIKFFDRNNLYSDHGNLNIALTTFNDILISVMSLEKNEDSIKIINFCNILNYKVHGCISKMMKYIISKYQPKSIEIKLDNRLTISKNSWLKHFNFKLVDDYDPQEYYIDGFNITRDKLDYCNMIFDCGSKLYKLNFNFY